MEGQPIPPPVIYDLARELVEKAMPCSKLKEFEVMKGFRGLRPGASELLPCIERT
jgi:hypothetical protein